MNRSRAFRIFKIALIAALAITVVSAVVMELWNLLLPDIFGLRVISFWQALGLLVLSKLLFGGFRPGGGAGRMRWRRRMMDRWERMTPEEREKFKEGMRRGCGFRPDPQSQSPQSEAQPSRP